MTEKPKPKPGKLHVLVRFLSHPFVRAYDWSTPKENSYPHKISEMSVLRRLDTGEFYRGSRRWQWCKNVRHAAYLDEGFWNGFVVWKIKKENINYEIVPLSEIEI